MDNDVNTTRDELLLINDEAAAARLARRAKEQKRKKARRFNAVLYCISGLLFLTGVFIILRSETTIFNRNSAETPEATFPPDDSIVISAATPLMETARPDESAPPPTEAAAPTAEPTQAPSAPVSIFFEGHSVVCRVEPVGVEENGVMATVPSHNVVGWYMYGACPNQQGNCIIAGHNRYAGQKGSFSLLHEGLKVGERVGVTLADGHTMFYRVVSIDTYLYNEVPHSVMDIGGEQRLTLITCLGDYDWDLQMSKSRVVAVCEPIS